MIRFLERIQFTPWILVALTLLWCQPVQAQDEWAIHKDAITFMEQGNFDLAVDAFQYIKHLPQVPFKAMVCSLMVNRFRNMPMGDFLAYESQKKEYPLYSYWLGEIYLKRLNIPKSKQSFQNFIAENSKMTEYIIRANQRLELIENFDPSLVILPLYSPINSTYSEIEGYYLKGGDTLIFASDRESTDSYKIYRSIKGPYGWDAPELVINESFEMNSFSLTEARGILYLYKANSDELVVLDGSAEPVMAEILRGAQHVYLYKYRNRLIFSKMNGTNQLDIYDGVKLRSTGKWMEPLVISPRINSAYNDDYPFLTKDRSRLYFSSDRTGGFGKMDIYYCDFDEENNQWGSPVNAGAPINSVDNDINFKILENNQVIISSDRMGSIGDYDLYVFEHGM